MKATFHNNKANQEHERAKALIAKRVMAMAHHTGLSVDFCAELEIGRIVSRIPQEERK